MMEQEVGYAHTLNYSVIVAAGNEPGSVNYPGAFDGMFTAAAGQVGGALCSYAAYGPQVEIVGPSCGVTDLDPFSGELVNGASNRGGSSVATVSTAALAAILRTFKPTASYADVETWIKNGSSNVNGYSLLNGTGAMRAAGLDDVVTRAKARMAVALNPSNSNPPATAKTLRSPRARVSFSRGFLRVKVSNRPAGAKLVVRLIYRRGEFASKTLKRSTKASSIKIRSRKRPWRVQVSYLKGASTSPTISFRDRRTSTYVPLKSASTD